MRIGILTLPLHTNYGGILQAYALQTVLERMGHQVVVFDRPLEKSKIPTWKKPFTYTKRIIKRYVLGRKDVQLFPIVFEPSSLQIDAFYKFYHWALGKYSDVVNIISDIAASIIMLWILYQYLLCIIRRLSSFSVHSIKAGDYQVEITDDKEDFKKVTGEILYYLESGSYDAVIFEDLDRIRNSKHLFLKLREINILLNESYYMKEKTITYNHNIEYHLCGSEL